MNFGPNAPLPEIMAVAQMVGCALLVIVAFYAGWTARGCCRV